ncbi:MAG: retropepsin-like aspartic protease [Caulobacteraceae bacterium]
MRIQGAAGADTLNGVVKAEKFEFDGASFKDVSFMATDRVTGVDGLLGQAFLKSVDVEYDLGGGMVRLAKAEGCNGVNMAYWAKDGAVYSVIPLEWVDRDDPHTEAAIYINGVRLRAAFDTGAGWSFITESAAARAGVKTGEAGVGPDPAGLRAWTPTSRVGWEPSPASRSGDEEIQNAPMMIGRSGADFDVLIGADFFLSHHLYVANSQGKIFFTYSGGPVFRAPRGRRWWRRRRPKASSRASRATAAAGVVSAPWPCAGPSRPCAAPSRLACSLRSARRATSATCSNFLSSSKALLRGVAGAGFLDLEGGDLFDQLLAHHPPALHVAGLVPAGVGIGAGALGLVLGLGVHGFDAALVGHAALGDLADALLQGLDLVLGDANEGVGPLHAHAIRFRSKSSATD